MRRPDPADRERPAVMMRDEAVSLQRRVAWMVLCVAALSGLAAAQPQTQTTTSPERAALLARFENPQDSLPQSGAGGTEWDACYRSFIQTDEAATSKGLPTHAEAARQILADGLRGADFADAFTGAFACTAEAYETDPAVRARVREASPLCLVSAGDPPAFIMRAAAQSISPGRHPPVPDVINDPHGAWARTPPRIAGRSSRS